uniref:CRIB domain-containing protein n=1 Tax=Leptobrachium leishanense TaxID=445787 RepID=A0A8C5WI83_9ANUR
MPILKQASSHTKKRTRIDREMISAPLGDFRHTMHVGRGGDVFGDTSFLSSHGPSSAPPVEIQAPNKNGSVSSSPVNNVPSKDDKSMLSFHLDLGPSIMDDVLGIMDRDSSSPEWNTPNDLCGFDYKFSPVRQLFFFFFYCGLELNMPPIPGLDQTYAL